MSATALKSLLHEAGVKDALIEYIYNPGITTVALFARVGISETEIRERITEPYFATLPEQPTSLPVRVLTEATVLSAWDDAKEHGLHLQPHLFQLLRWRPRVLLQLLRTRPTTAYCPLQVEKYESSWSPRRSFPVKMLLGAESVLVRLLHEANSCRMFTPVGLGEILKNPAYVPNGHLNVLAQKKI